ncbi:MAG: aminotransferase class IV [Spirochaetes bacterium]|nr:aminotransferase class IV [Spirochaetota bacterium]
MNSSRKILFNSDNFIELNKIIKIPEHVNNELFKCRIVYDTEIKKIEFLPYSIRLINSLKIVHTDDIEYSFKYENRDRLNELLKNKKNCDDVLIVKNGRITDTSFSNIVFFDNSKWLTPDKPLFKGTKREKLLDQKIIFEDEISLKDLKFFKKARLINSMIEFEDNLDILIENII